MWKKIDKLDRTKPRALEGRLVDYGNLEGTIYYIYIPATKKVLRCSDVKFEDAEVLKHNGYEELDGVAELEDLLSEDLGVAIEDPTAETVNPNPLLTPSPKGTHDVLESHPREETTIVEAQGPTPPPDVVRIVLDDFIEKERKALDSEGPMPSPKPFLSEDNEFYDASPLGLPTLQTGKESFKKQNKNSDSDNGEVLYQPVNQNIANIVILNASDMPGVFPYKNLDRTIIENPEPNPERTIIEDPEPNPDRTIIEDPESDSDSNSSSEFIIMAENHLQKNEGKLRDGSRKEYNVQKLTKQAFGKALVYLEKDQFIPDNGDIYFALLSIEAAISSQIINLLHLFPKSYKEARAKYWDNWEPAFRKQYENLINRHIWDLVFAPKGANVLPGKWVLDQKHENDGTWIRNRARWVVCGNFEGTEGWSAQDLYAAVASAVAVKIFFTLIAIYGMIST
jgi:hypothetical protein